MDSEIEKKIIDNNEKISKLLVENEKLIRELGYNPPVENYVVDSHNRIKIPKGYIRTSKDLSDKYHLDSIVYNYDVKKNISYSLQFLDFYNYLLNRVYIWGSIQTILYKYDIIHIVSIFEALIYEARDNVRKYCKDCKKINLCKNHITKNDKHNLKSSLNKLCEIGILDYSSEKVNKILELNELRNRIHIRLANGNEFLDSKFNLEAHNYAILLLIDIANELNEQVVPYYNKCVGFDKKDKK